MSLSAELLIASIDAIVSAVRALPADKNVLAVLADAELLEVQHKLGDAQRAIDACSSATAGEVGHRSRRELGYRGLAQREGFRTPEALVQHETGSTSRAASTLVQVGEMMHDALTTVESMSTGAAVRRPWLIAVGAAVSAATLSVDAAKAIESGLGPCAANPDPGSTEGYITADDLAGAVRVLLSEAAQLNADQLYRRARELRDDLDAAGIADRERAIYLARSIRRVRRPNGMSRYIVDPDLESGAYWDAIYDKITPRVVVAFGSSMPKAKPGPTRSRKTSAQPTSTCMMRSPGCSASASPPTRHRVVVSWGPASPPFECSSPRKRSPPVRDTDGSKARPSRSP